MSDYYGYIYKTTNLINDKIYIGQCGGKIYNRRKGYLGSGVLISRALKKYGRKNFKKEILCYCETLEGLNIQEIYYIAFYKNQGYTMYNITDGGGGALGLRGEKASNYGKTFSEETRKKMGDWQRGEKSPMYGKSLSDEHKAIISNANKNKIISDDTRKKMSKANKGEKNSMYGKEGFWKGKNISIEVKEKISKSKKGIPLSDEHKKKIGESLSGEKNPNFGKKGILSPKYGQPGFFLGKHHTEESKKKIGDSMRGEKHPNFGKHIGVGQDNPFYGKNHTPESCLKMSISRTGEKNHRYRKYGKENPLSKKVLQIDVNTNEIIKIWDSGQDIKRELGLRHISECCNGKVKTCGGFKWAYVKS